MHVAIQTRHIGRPVAALIAALSALLCGDVAADHTPAPYQQHCIACHARMTGGEGEMLYRRHDRLVNDHAALLARIEYCRRGAGADWNKKQTNTTADYLNRRFYHFQPLR